MQNYQWEGRINMYFLFSFLDGRRCNIKNFEKHEMLVSADFARADSIFTLYENTEKYA
jgi:hypothetical protein